MERDSVDRVRGADVSARKTQLVDCDPKWVMHDGRYSGVRFSCPEGHSDCIHVIPFSPALDGKTATSWYSSGVTWSRTGITKEIGVTGEADEFDSLTLSPSIRRVPQHANREAAIAAGCIPEHVTDSLLCALHIFIRNGQIEFCGDSK